MPSVPTKDIERYHKHYSELEERASKEIKEYENITAIAIDNATKAGITNPEQYISEYAQDCKIAYLDDCEKRKALLSKIKIVIHSDGSITSTNTDTGESARFTNQFEFIE